MKAQELQLESGVADRRDADDRRGAAEITLSNDCSRKELRELSSMFSWSHPSRLQRSKDERAKWTTSVLESRFLLFLHLIIDIW
jgi:hypothetical protein